MVNRITSGAAAVVAGLLIAIGPQVLFSLCEPKEDGSWMKCHWMGQAEIGVGGMIAVLGIALLLTSSPQTRLGLSEGIAAAGVVALLLPTVLIGGCGTETMPCRSLTIPCLIVISILTITAAVANCIYLGRRRAGAPAQPRETEPAQQ